MFTLPTLSEKLLHQQIAALERENAEQRAELEKARKLAYLGSMATTVAHELTQPVHIIHATTSAALEDIKDNLLESNEIKPLLERIYRQTRRLHKLIQNFRQFAQSDINYQKAVNLNQLLEQTIDTIFEIQFKKHNINLVRVLGKSTLMVRANPFQLQVVLSILLTNAKEVLERRENATVWVKTFQTQHSDIGFSIEDNGSGLDPEYRIHLFEPFVSTKKRGTGLGLYLAHKLIQELKGQLHYKDRSGGGACFIVTLPIQEDKRLWNDNINY
jgi:C4-dicarboxylate-specific signal transduction histidine kinase